MVCSYVENTRKTSVGSHVAPVKSSSLSVSIVSTCPTTSELGHVTVYRGIGLWGWLGGGGGHELIYDKQAVPSTLR